MQDTLRQIEKQVRYKDTRKDALGAAVKIRAVQVAPKLVVGTKEK